MRSSGLMSQVSQIYNRFLTAFWAASIKRSTVVGMPWSWTSSKSRCGILSWSANEIAGGRREAHWWDFSPQAFASIGGYLVGDKALVDMIRSYAGGLIFTTSLPPPVLAAALTSIAILKSREGRQLREEQRRRVSVVRRRLQEAGLPIPDVPSHIIPIFVSRFRFLTAANTIYPK